ncbi:MAG: hypothetical protein AAFY15_00705 [Cyanobacteria bacterium J06648_11]
MLPTLSLVALGSIWLFQNNLVITWALVAFVVTAASYALGVLLARRLDTLAVAVPETSSPDQVTQGHDAVQARQAVDKLIQGLEPHELKSRADIQRLAFRTVQVVAKEIHPGVKDPVWRFTLPEALALSEQVTARLQTAVSHGVPFGDRITVGQALALYRSRRFLGVVERGYDLWRIIRVINPAAAVAGELRDRMSGRMFEGLRDEFVRTLAGSFVREIGNASIDLYSGRLRPRETNRAVDGTVDSRPDETIGEIRPRYAVMGFDTALIEQVASSLSSAQVGDRTAGDQARQDAERGTDFIAFPPFTLTSAIDDALLSAARGFDVVIWLREHSERGDLLERDAARIWSDDQIAPAGRHPLVVLQPEKTMQEAQVAPGRENSLNTNDPRLIEYNVDLHGLIIAIDEIANQIIGLLLVEPERKRSLFDRLRGR